MDSDIFEEIIFLIETSIGIQNFILLYIYFLFAFLIFNNFGIFLNVLILT